MIVLDILTMICWMYVGYCVFMSTVSTFVWAKTKGNPVNKKEVDSAILANGPYVLVFTVVLGLFLSGGLEWILQEAFI